MSEEQTDLKTYLAISISTNTLSMVGSLFMIICYFVFKDIQSFAFKLVLYLNLSDFLLSLGYVINFIRYENEVDSHTDICQVQAFLVSFGGLSAVSWTGIIAWALYQSVINGKTEAYLNEKLFMIIGFGIPLGLAIYPLFTNDYGDSGYICWVDQAEDNKQRELIIKLINFYIPLTAVILFNFTLYISVMIYLHKLVDRGESKAFIYKLILYPMILIICWSCVSVNQMILLFTDSKLEWLTLVASFLSGLQGFLNSIVYGFTEQVKDNLLRCLPCCRNQIEDKDANRGASSVEMNSQTDNATPSQSESEPNSVQSVFRFSQNTYNEDDIIQPQQ